MYKKTHPIPQILHRAMRWGSTLHSYEPLREDDRVVFTSGHALIEIPRAIWDARVDPEHQGALIGKRLREDDLTITGAQVDRVTREFKVPGALAYRELEVCRRSLQRAVKSCLRASTEARRQGILAEDASRAMRIVYSDENPHTIDFITHLQLKAGHPGHPAPHRSSIIRGREVTEIRKGGQQWWQLHVDPAILDGLLTAIQRMSDATLVRLLITSDSRAKESSIETYQPLAVVTHDGVFGLVMPVRV